MKKKLRVCGWDCYVDTDAIYVCVDNIKKKMCRDEEELVLVQEDIIKGLEDIVSSLSKMCKDKDFFINKLVEWMSILNDTDSSLTKTCIEKDYIIKQLREDNESITKRLWEENKDNYYLKQMLEESGIQEIVLKRKIEDLEKSIMVRDKIKNNLDNCERKYYGG